MLIRQQTRINKTLFILILISILTINTYTKKPAISYLKSENNGYYLSDTKSLRTYLCNRGYVVPYARVRKSKKVLHYNRCAYGVCVCVCVCVC